MAEEWRSPIAYSVGHGGTNRREDVRAVQDLLNDRAKATTVATDGVCGPATVGAIRKFQSAFMARPDGRVDPDGVTIKRLTGHESASATGSPTAPAASSRFEQLPQSTQKGYYSYAKAARQYGTPTMVNMLKTVGDALASEGLEMGVGDLSLSEGGDLPPHKTHRDGSHVDLRPIRTDRKRQPVTIAQTEEYDAQATLRLVEMLAGRDEVRAILFNDSTMKGLGGKVKPWAGHDNHLHASVR